MSKRGAYVKSSEPVYVRSNIIERVKAGGWSIATAEKVAARLRVGPLAKSPPVDVFNPLNAVAWTLDMAIAWIVWRTPEALCRSWAPYQAECLVWRDVEDETESRWADLVLGRVVTLAEMQLDEALDDYDESKIVTVHDAQIELRSKLWSGASDLHAEGRTADDNRRWLSIPGTQWAVVQISSNSAGETVLRQDGDGGPIAFTDVILQSNKVRELWPSESRLSTASSNSSTHQNRGLGPAIEGAILSLWPEGIPVGLSVQERDRQITSAMRRIGSITGERSINAVTFRRFFNRRATEDDS